MINGVDLIWNPLGSAGALSSRGTSQVGSTYWGIISD